MSSKNNSSQKKRGPVKGVKLEQVSRSEFGKRLFTIRRNKGISQEQLGEMVGVSFRMISYYERDVNGPPVLLLKKIANVLGVTASYLLGESPLKITINEEIKPQLKKAVQKLQKLPLKDQKTIIRMVDAFAVQSKITEED